MIAIMSVLIPYVFRFYAYFLLLIHLIMTKFNCRKKTEAFLLKMDMEPVSSKYIKIPETRL